MAHKDLSEGRRGSARKPASYTTRALAERYLRHAGRWVKTTELCAHLDLPASSVINPLRQAEKQGTVRSQAGDRGALSWQWITKDQEPARRFSIDWPPGFVSRWAQA